MPQLRPDITGVRAAAILVNASKWVNGTVLRFYSFDRDTDGEDVDFADGSTEWRARQASSGQQKCARFD